MHEMNVSRTSWIDSATSRISPFWRGHLLLFDRPPAQDLSSKQGGRLLLVFLFLELAVRPLLLYGSRQLALTSRPWWPIVQVVFLVTLACWLVKGFAGVPLSQLGLRSWRRWSKTEKLYLLQVVPIAIVIFSFVRFAALQRLLARPDLYPVAALVYVSEMIWGFYQELMYRGVLQTELTRRWGPGAGILLGNLIFTFGPLHAYHFLAARGNPSHLWIFAAIFSIGLLFAVLFRRSGNLWMIAIMHGIGDSFIDGLGRIARMTSAIRVITG
jgi:membrane protease YdiL (CAAX protease family)